MTARELSNIIDLDYETILKYLSKEGVDQVEFGPKGKGLNEITNIEMVNFLRELDWAKGCPGNGKTLFLGVSVRVSPEKTGI